MGSLPRDFYVTLSSNASVEYFPSNMVNAFSNRLAEPLRLDEGLSYEWEVGLVEIMVPPNRGHLDLGREDLTVELLHVTTLMNGQFVDEVRAVVELKPFWTGSAFTTNLQNALKDPSLPKAFKEHIRVDQPREGGTNVFGLHLDTEMYVKFTPRMRKVLGVDPKYVDECGRVGTIEHEGMTIEGVVDLTAGFHSMWVYSNCCEHRAVGGVRVPLLRTLVLKSKDFERVYHRIFIRPDYVPVSLNYLPSLEVFITDNTGTPIPFFPGEAVVNLHFRPRRR